MILPSLAMAPATTAISKALVCTSPWPKAVWARVPVVHCSGGRLLTLLPETGKWEVIVGVPKAEVQGHLREGLGPHYFDRDLGEDHVDGVGERPRERYLPVVLALEVSDGIARQLIGPAVEEGLLRADPGLQCRRGRNHLEDRTRRVEALGRAVDEGARWGRWRARGSSRLPGWGRRMGMWPWRGSPRSWGSGRPRRPCPWSSPESS